MQIYLNDEKENKPLNLASSIIDFYSHDFPSDAKNCIREVAIHLLAYCECNRTEDDHENS